MTWEVGVEDRASPAGRSSLVGNSVALKNETKTPRALEKVPPLLIFSAAKREADVRCRGMGVRLRIVRFKAMVADWRPGMKLYVGEVNCEHARCRGETRASPGG